MADKMPKAEESEWQAYMPLEEIDYFALDLMDKGEVKGTTGSTRFEPNSDMTYQQGAWVGLDARRESDMQRGTILPFKQTTDGGATLAFPGMVHDPYVTMQDMRDNPKLPSDDPDIGRKTVSLAETFLGGAPAALTRGGSSLGTFGGRVGAKRIAEETGNPVIMKGLSQAAELEAKGFPESRIREVIHGMFDDQGYKFGSVSKGADGNWRFEIDDSKMQIRSKASDTFDITPVDKQLPPRTVTEFIDHPDLFQAYPALRNMKLEVKKLSPGERPYGSYMPNHSIEIGASSIQDVKTVLLHEIQHHLQYEEKFAAGANPANQLTKQEGERLFETWNAQISAIRKARSDAKKKKTPEAQAALDEAIDLHLKEFGDVKDQRDFSFIAYRRDAGEVEARNVETRAELTAGERREQTPFSTEDVPRRVQSTSQERYARNTVASIPQPRPAGKTPLEEAPKQGTLDMFSNGSLVVRKNTDTTIKRAQRKEDVTLPYPTGHDPSISTVIDSKTYPRKVEAVRKALAKTTEDTISFLERELKKEAPGKVSFKRMDSKGSLTQYVEAIDNTTGRPIAKIRLGEHASSDFTALSIDPVSGNRPLQALEIIKYELGLTDKVPTIGWSFSPVKPIKNVLRAQAEGLTVFPQNRQIGGYGEYIRGAYSEGKRVFKPTRQTIGTDIQWQFPE